MVMRFDALSEVDRLTQQLAGRLQDSGGTMAMDAYRRGDEVPVHFDVPGVTRTRSS
jgi:HSP20 family molecular chaperone IbpA